ncbi:MAG: diaminopimelate decarboxylase [Kiritimatiellia bacterium]|nr:diaminopimelate decarboxylase [Kiritimatiellia bacterium]
MTDKHIPFTLGQIQDIIKRHPTPFHIYDEAAILANARKLTSLFAWNPGFREYFAVKACPNPVIMQLLAKEGFGMDCSSLAELVLSEKVGVRGEQIMFTSNDTPDEEFIKAKALGAVLNLDDITHLGAVEAVTGGLPELICFRYNPGPLKEGNAIIGKPEEAKYGLTRDQLFEAYRRAKAKGVRRFGLHTMVASNELNPQYFVETARLLFDLVVELSREVGITFDFVNMGGGIGIPYKPEQTAVDLQVVSDGVRRAYEETIVRQGLPPVALYMECGRMITGPYGYLVTTVRRTKETYRHYLGMDACMADLMRPALYGAYHHITNLSKQGRPNDHIYDVTGSLCENNDKFAIARKLPESGIGDILVIHDAGAHGRAMGFNYNGKLRCGELLLRPDGTVLPIRRAETLEDYFATLDFTLI